MSMSAEGPRHIGWIGAGRMGFELARRLLDAGYDVTVWNRTRAKAEPLAELGARLAQAPAELADRDVVFTMVAGSEDLKAVTIGPEGVLSGGRAPAVLVDSSTVSVEASREVRARAHELGCALLAAPVSGNPKVVSAGRATLVASGPRSAFDTARPVLEALGRGVTYVGEDDGARLVKICHNLLLGVVAQSLAETTVLAQKAGIARSDYLAFINDSVLGSAFTRYKTPALVTLDYAPTFTLELLRKDFDLGLEAAEELGAELPLSERVRALVQGAIDSGFTELDFASLLSAQAGRAGLELEPEPGPVSDGLAPVRG